MGPRGGLRWLEVPGWTRSGVGVEVQLALVKLTGTRVSDSFTRVVSSLCACVSGYVMNASTDYNLGRTAHKQPEARGFFVCSSPFEKEVFEKSFLYSKLVTDLPPNIPSPS